MEELLEDYKRRLATISTLIRIAEQERNIDSHKRLVIKESCYRTFVLELERVIDKELKGEK